ncbi:MAG TPA: ABC transporter ATP-binding protein [Alkalispirochaeta sp.]|nr:ABC transporter ATP-binding protein [Alkalispirochaeta sp.]
MIEHHHDEKVISGYDPRLVRRIAAYGRPYGKLIATAMFFLIIATIGEVLVPVMIQRTVDHEILDYWVSVQEAEVARFGDVDTSVAVDDRIFLREEILDRIPRSEREQLAEENRLDTTRMIIVSQEVLRVNPDIAETIAGELRAENEGVAVFPRSILNDLSQDERLLLREENVRGLQRNVVIFLTILVTVLIASFGQVYLTAYTGQLVMKDLRLRIFDHTMHQHLGFLSMQPVGRLVTRATNDVETINELFTSVLAELTRNLSLMVAVVITMYSLNSRLATIVLVSMLPIVLITDIFRRKARNAFRRVRIAVSTVNAYLSEYISGMAVVQLFVQQTRSRREFAARNDELLGAHLSEMRIFAVFRPIVDLMASISTAVVIYFGARLLQIELVSLGVLIAYTNLIRRFYMPVMSISEQFTVLQSAMAGAERVFDLLDTDQRIPDTGSTGVDPGTVRGSISFETVDFSYKPKEPVLRKLSFSVEPGEMVAVVGYTGAGKTTIINLLTRLWDVDTGSITLDGTDIRDIPLGSLRRSVQQIQQDVHLFSDSIRTNITLGADIPEERIWDACRAVQLADYLEALPEGLDTMVQERGANLSAGQRQLISFARALVHDPPVLVLDEATSSIDSETEHRLQHAVTAVTGGRTSLVIAHRLSTIQHADTIIVLSHGELLEKGSHQDLLARDGHYATLYRLQYAQQDNFEN